MMLPNLLVALTFLSGLAVAAPTPSTDAVIDKRALLSPPDLAALAKIEAAAAAQVASILAAAAATVQTTLAAEAAAALKLLG